DNGLIGEINTTPGIHHHYLIAEDSGKADVAERLLEYMFSAGQGVMDLEPGHRIANFSAQSNSAKTQNRFAVSQVN
ncbi:MAG: hypothetical protein K8F25_06660, partial [Fimbriimonadaceae bacterium]|nr:hypothetical protein [Alphaproteobacteria bacterium]